MGNKRKWGDRRDAALVRDLDAMHYIMPLIYPNRCDNEAFLSEEIDLTNIMAYLERKNAANPDFHYSLFQIIVTAVLKTITHRPLMNRFICNKSLYQRNYVSAAFTMKKKFADDGGEGFVILKAHDNDTIDTIHEEFARQVTTVRNDVADEQSSTDKSMNIVTKMPRFLSRALVAFVRYLDRHGKAPRAFTDGDPNYASAFITNLGSIKLHAGYHHLSNWGTTSFFLIVGERKLRPVYDENGNVTMRMSVDIGLTVDERIADGYYFAKTIRLMKKLLENPELLEKPISEEIDY